MRANGTSVSPALRCERLRKRFGPTKAVDEASLDVPDGTLLALLGPSGCGKTTILRLIAGLDIPDAGTITIRGVEVQSERVSVPPERRRVGMVFQDYALFPHLDVRQNVGFGLPRGPAGDGRAERALEQVGLAALAQRMPHELSGGQQQRVALARALAPDPRLVLLDEPFSNLDATLRVELREEIRDVLRRAAATAVFVTHDQEEALSLADEVAVMMDGRILQVATPDDLYRRPASRAVAEFVGEANLVPGRGMGRAVVCELGTVAIPEPMIGGVDLLIRPEALQLTVDPAGPAVLRTREFFGHDQLVTIEFESGLRLDCRTGPGFTAPVGTRVRAQLDGDVLAFLRSGIAPRRDPAASLMAPDRRGRLALGTEQGS